MPIPFESLFCEGNSWSVEISQLPGFRTEQVIYVQRGNEQIRFRYVKTDKDSTGEDTYGWRYVGLNEGGGQIKLLIVND
jgi:hypothetical protein